MWSAAAIHQTPQQHTPQRSSRGLMAKESGTNHTTASLLLLAHTCLQLSVDKLRGDKGSQGKNQTGQALGRKEPSRRSFDSKASSLIVEITPVSRGKHTESAGDKHPEQGSSKDSTPKHLNSSYSLRKGSSRSTSCQNSLSPSSGEAGSRAEEDAAALSREC